MIGVRRRSCGVNLSKTPLDAFDRRILATLQREARITNAQLSSVVNLSPSACLVRHRRLEEAGVILGYRAEIALERLRPVIRVMLQIKLRRHQLEDFRQTEQLLRDDPRVIEAAEVSGEMDFCAMVCLQDIAELRSMIEELTAANPAIENIKSCIMIHSTKRFSDVPID